MHQKTTLLHFTNNCFQLESSKITNSYYATSRSKLTRICLFFFKYFTGNLILICLVDKFNGFTSPSVSLHHTEHCTGLNWSHEGGEKASNNPSSCLEEKSLQLRQSCGQFPRHPFSDTLVWPKWNHRKLPEKEKSSVALPLSAHDLGWGRVSGSCRKLLNQATRMRNKVLAALFITGWRWLRNFLFRQKSDPFHQWPFSGPVALQACIHNYYRKIHFVLFTDAPASSSSFLQDTILL